MDHRDTEVASLKHAVTTLSSALEEAMRMLRKERERHEGTSDVVRHPVVDSQVDGVDQGGEAQ